ncbi:twin-arginine translocation pathway signal protein, partial [Pseudomonas sp. HMWF010]
AEVTANPDGIELEGPIFEAGRLVGFMTRQTLADPKSTAFQQGLELYRSMALSARAFGWITNENRSRIDQINAGRAYVRINLKATSLGLGVHPWSQALQEYAEMEDLYREVHGLIADGKRIQMLYRIGYGPQVGPTPRRGLDAHLA